MKSGNYLSVVLLLLGGTGIGAAQSNQLVPKGEVQPGASLISVTREYKASSEHLLELQKNQIDKATLELEQLRQLVADGLVAKNELVASESSLAALKANFQAIQKKVGDAEQMIAEIQAKDLRNTKAAGQALSADNVRNLVKPTVLRYNGATNWSVAHLAGIQTFFRETFGRSLPTSTIGQSATHNRLGWDHRNSVDVGLHPDSAEGKRLISFLQTQGIPFLAFRGAIPGVSTGAHIHIGRPSQRLS
jgi:hypothetical protein